MGDRRDFDQVDNVQRPQTTDLLQLENAGGNIIFDEDNQHDKLRQVKSKILELERMMTVRLTQDIDVNNLHGVGLANTFFSDQCYGIFHHPHIWRRNIHQFQLASIAQNGKPQFVKMEFLGSRNRIKENVYVEFFPHTRERAYYQLAKSDEGVLAYGDGNDECILSCQHVHVNVFEKMSECYSELVRIRENKSNREILFGRIH